MMRVASAWILRVNLGGGEMKFFSEDITWPGRLVAAGILSMIGGFMDSYTYLCRDGVFANALTGNMVLLGYNFSRIEWHGIMVYTLAIFCYSCGILAAEVMHRNIRHWVLFSWHHWSLLLEIGLLVVVCFIPHGSWDFVVSSVVSFVCALQVQTFRKVHGQLFSSTMCTGNLHSGTTALYKGIWLKDNTQLRLAFYYFGLISCFIAGVAIGALLIRHFGERAFLLAPVMLTVVFFFITSNNGITGWRRSYLKIFGRRPE